MASLKPVRCFNAAILRPQTPAAAAKLSARPLGPASVRYKSGPYGYTQAKALVFAKAGEPSDVLSLHTHSISPSLPSSSVLVRTLAAPVNPADVNLIQGTYGAKPVYTTHLGTAVPTSIPGNEGCLEVLSVGSGVASLKKGDWCIPASTGFGTWRTHALVENADAALLKIDNPAGLTPLQVATVSVNPSSAYRMLKDYVDLIDLSVKTYQRDSATQGGAWFIQNGANSGVGRAAIQLGQLWGLRSINIIREREGDAQATEQLKKELYDLGATVVVTEAEFMDRSFTARLKEEFTRGGKDPLMLGLNCVGGKSATAMAKCLSESGTLVTYGAMSKQPVMLPTGLLIFRDLRFKGFWLSRWANADRAAKKQTVEEILGLIRDGKFKDAPVQEVKWNWETEDTVLREAVQGTLGGFRAGKGVFMFGDT
ncbi:alcohol dehydrogenase superfamily, zinc-containing protein [Coniella lustricola]|uniref:enoyl-[acyl-carrier-protein] reductase n=1 Tax=Coniella lustricola TaxID=2025994 RepID=A0A2T2ZX92_9PEZI|nr:alcohol dehydrogenase superfamily, zinc-containing protein [Coniella lustricola]